MIFAARRPRRRPLPLVLFLLLALVAAVLALVPAPSGAQSPPDAAAPSGAQPYFDTAVVDLDVPAASGVADIDDVVGDGAVPGWARQVALPLDGQMVNLIWEGADDVGLEIRSHNADGWSDWVDAHLDADEGPDEGREGGSSDRHLLGPVWVGSGTDLVEVRVDHGEPRNLDLEVLKSVEPEGWSFDGAAAGAVAPDASGIQAAKPPIIGRAQWGAGPWRSDNSDCAGGPFYADELRFAVIHHTVSTNSYQPWESDDIIRGIYYGHTGTNGWCDIAYNFVVDKYGQIFEGRSQSVLGAVIGAHAKGFNYASVGVALLGQYHPGASPPAAGVSLSQRLAIADLIAWKFDQWAISAYGTTWEISGGSTSIPEGQWVLLSTITGHRNVGATGCPGDNMYNLMPQLRADVDARTVGQWWAFSDVKPLHPFFDEIQWNWANGLTNGYPDGTFRPLSWITRQAAINSLYRFAASPAGPFPDPGFSDVPPTHPFYKQIAWAADRGITTGYADGTFKPSMWVPRKSMAVWLYRLASEPGGPYSSPGFPDVPTSHEFYDAIAWAKAEGIISGYADGTFKPDKPVTRQAVAKYMYEYKDLF